LLQRPATTFGVFDLRDRWSARLIDVNLARLAEPSQVKVSNSYPKVGLEYVCGSSLCSKPLKPVPARRRIERSGLHPLIKAACPLPWIGALVSSEQVGCAINRSYSETKAASKKRL
jgi:hypothetical protein